MGIKRHGPEEIVAKLRQVEMLVGQGRTQADAIRAIGVTEQTYYRWRKAYGGMGTEQLRELKRLQKENERLRRPPPGRCGIGLSSIACRFRHDNEAARGMQPKDKRPSGCVEPERGAIVWPALPATWTSSARCTAGPHQSAVIRTLSRCSGPPSSAWTRRWPQTPVQHDFRPPDARHRPSPPPHRADASPRRRKTDDGAPGLFPQSLIPAT